MNNFKQHAHNCYNLGIITPCTHTHTHTHTLYLLPQEFRQKLPSWQKQEEILKIVHENQVAVISGETGCGKTTQVKRSRTTLCLHVRVWLLWQQGMFSCYIVRRCLSSSLMMPSWVGVAPDVMWSVLNPGEYLPFQVHTFNVPAFNCHIVEYKPVKYS